MIRNRGIKRSPGHVQCLFRIPRLKSFRCLPRRRTNESYTRVSESRVLSFRNRARTRRTSFESLPFKTFPIPRRPLGPLFSSEIRRESRSIGIVDLKPADSSQRIHRHSRPSISAAQAAWQKRAPRKGKQRENESCGGKKKDTRGNTRN